MIIALVDEAYDAGGRISSICCLIGVSTRTLQRWRKESGVMATAPNQLWSRDITYLATKHKHSCLKFVCPAKRYHGEDTAILEQRTALCKTAKKLHPERWSECTRDWTPEKIVYLNPNK